MQFTLAAIFAAATSASALARRNDTGSYSVTDFYASCIPHSTLCR